MRGTGTAFGEFHWATVLCGSATPSCANTYWTRPEQSKPVAGLAPAHVYGMPRYCAAIETTPPYWPAPAKSPYSDAERSWPEDAWSRKRASWAVAE